MTESDPVARVVVIGAGFGGLAAAIRLVASGHEVVILEKRDQPGGRAGVFRQDGFTFDAGPTIITAPHLIDELFTIAGRRREEFVELVPLDPFYRVRFSDGTFVDWSRADDKRERAIGSIHEPDVLGYRRFAQRSQAIFEEAYPLIDRSFDSVTTMAKAFPALVRSQAWKSVASLVDESVSDARVRQLLSFHPLLIGGNPYDSPSIYSLIHELERRWGVWFAMGGTGALVSALVRLFAELGGELRLNAEVKAISIGASGAADAVVLDDGECVPADVVVCNGDVVRSYRDMVPRSHRRVNTDRRLDRYRQSMSLFVLYFGTDRRYENIAHHEIVLGPRYRGLLDDVFNHRTLADDFSLYLHRPTATDPSLAPPGCDAWYVLSPVPNLGSGTDWSSVGDAYRDRIVRHLEQSLLPDLSKRIVTERRVDPRYFSEELNSHLGSAFSVQPLLTQSAWFRPHCRSEDVPNLYFAGAGTHPGAGIPGVLSSAKIVASMVARDRGRLRSQNLNAKPSHGIPTPLSPNGVTHARSALRFSPRKRIP